VSGLVDELLDSVDRALEDYSQADRVTRSVELLTNLEKQVSPYVEDLDRTVAAFGALDQVHRLAERPQTQALAVACREAAEQVRKHKSAPHDLPRTLRNIQEVVNNATVMARDAWREFIDESMPGLDGLNNLAQMLRQMGADQFQVASLQKGITDLRALSRRLPDASSPNKAAAAVDVIYPALTILLGGSGAENEEVSEEVRFFMETVAQGGAPLRALTPAVKEWIRRMSLENSFKIVAGRPASE
jgi:hypothetical protein